MALSLRFDAGSLAREQGGWAFLLSHTSQAFRLGSVIALATLGFGLARARAELLQVLECPQMRAPWWPSLLAHFSALAVFVWLTALVLEERVGDSPCPAPLAVPWGLAGALTLVFWGATLLPLALWLSLARQGLLALSAGVIIGGTAWGAGLCSNTLWRPLGRWTLWVVAQILCLVSDDVVCDPSRSIVGTASFTVEIAPSCSGYEGIGLTLVFLCVYLWVYRFDLRFPQALCLIPVGAALIWLANAVRIAALVAVGTWGSPAVALGGFHSQAGWLAFIGVMLGLVAVSRQTQFFSPSIAASYEANPAAPYLVPGLAILATTMVTGAFASGFDWLYPARVVVAGAALWYFRRTYAEWSWGWSWPAVAMGVAVFGLWMALEPTPSEPAGAGELAAGLAGRPGGWAVAWLLFRVLGSVVTVPVAEELAFRGYLARRLIAADFESVPIGKLTLVSFVVSSVAFGVLHDRWLAGTIAGMLYAITLAVRGRISDAVLAHATTNALIAASVLLTGAWHLWS
jgi:exosortase E/protease (VPEID-CTERM system)